MTILRTLIVGLIVVAPSFAPSSRANGGVLTDLITTRQAKLDELMVVSTSEMTPDQKKVLGDTLSAVFDFEAMSRTALRSAWDEHTAAEQEEFVAAFGRLIRLSSMKSVDLYKKVEIEYAGEVIDENRGEVNTVVSSEKAITDVDYSFRRNGDAWWVVDYTIDGVSAMRNYRSQFKKIIKKHGWDGLIQKIVSRADKLETDG